MSVPTIKSWENLKRTPVEYQIVRIGSTRAALMNVIPFECYAYSNVVSAKHDEVWRGLYDIFVVPSQTTVRRAIHQFPQVENQLSSRLREAVQLAVMSNKPLLYASTKCGACSLRDDDCLPDSGMFGINIEDQISKIRY